MVKIENIRIEDLLNLLNRMNREGIEVVDMLIDMDERSVTLVAVDPPEKAAPKLKIRDDDIENIM